MRKQHLSDSAPSFKNQKDTMGLGYRPLRLFLALFLFNAIFAATVASQYSPIRIKVLTAEFHPVANSSPVPVNCDMQNFDAYCNESKNPTGENVMQVQDSDGHSFTISCSVDSRWSRCGPLSVGETYEARKGKHGLTVWMQASNGKETTRLYRLAGEDTGPESGAAANSTPSAASAALPRPAPAPQPVAVAPGQKASDAAPVPAPPPPSRSMQKDLSGNIMCNFSSIPPGAEITLDGKYVGNTPSGIPLSAGTHTVILSLPGFTQWKRDLTVSPGSDLTVSGILQKEQ
jgi:hypothetical protein